MVFQFAGNCPPAGTGFWTGGRTARSPDDANGIPMAVLAGPASVALVRFGRR